MTIKDVITEWGQIYRWDGGDARAEAAEEAEALIKRLADAGFVIVPKEPTDAMLQAAFIEMGSPSDGGLDACAYRAMIAAAPDIGGNV